MDIVEYTHNEIKKNLALLETHFKQAFINSNKDFCKECIEKHILILEGLAEEGIIACEDCDIKNYQALLLFLKSIDGRDIQIEGIKLAIEIRKLRKNFIACDEDIGMKDRDDIKKKIAELEEEKSLAKDTVSQDRLEYAKYILNWIIRGKKCS